MDKSQFWELISDVHEKAEGDPHHKAELLAEELSSLFADEVADFQQHFDECMDDAYQWDLWAAAHVIGGGCSDDAFMDFRGWLISMGEQVFEHALDAPDSLAEVVDPETAAEYCFLEGFQYVASDIYEEKTGKDMPRRHAEAPRDPHGRAWEEDELPALAPRLCAKFNWPAA